MKEPVTCQRNEHYFCQACITEHLKNFQKCPTCYDDLSQETLTQVPKILQNYLDELNIRCDYSDRGCQEILQLSQLQNHIDLCGFAPEVCPNEGCLAQVNRRDLAGHQQALCEFRKCSGCSELKNAVDEINENTNSLSSQMKNLTSLKDINESLLAVKQEVAKTRAETSQVFQRLEVLEEQVRAQSSNPIKTHQPQNILVAGGRRSDFGEMKLVEIFNLHGMLWSPLAEMNESRVGASVFMCNNEVTIVGGNTNHGPTDTMAKIAIGPRMKSALWSQVPMQLPTKSYGHTSVFYHGTLAHIGGCNKNKNVSKQINMVQKQNSLYLPIPPYSMPEPRCFHGAQVFDNKVFIFGGRSSFEYSTSLNSVISVNLKEQKTKQLASLPYPVSEMAIVSWSDNVILVGGADQHGKPLSTVVIYNVKKERWHILPPMNEKRKGCSAVIVDNMLIVMGGRTQNNTCLRSVECFSFNDFWWQDFPAMITARERAVAVAF